VFLRDEAAALGLKMVAILVSVRDRLRDPAVQKLKGRGWTGVDSLHWEDGWTGRLEKKGRRKQKWREERQQGYFGRYENGISRV